MAKTEFKYLPRFADNESKQKNLVDFMASMNVGKKDDKINDFGDFFLFNNLYNSCAEIMRKKEALADRNIKSTVHTIVSSSKTSNDLAYIADNFDGVIESMREQVAKFGNESDFTKLAEAAKAWEKVNKDAELLSNKLKELVDSNLQKGYGTRYQLKQLERQNFEAKKDEVEELLNSGKTPSEIASTLDLKAGFIMNFESELIERKLNNNITLIKNKIAENVNRADIAEELNVSKNRLSKFISDKKLVDAAKPKAKTVAKQKQEPTTKVKPANETKPAKAKTDTKPTADKTDTKATA